MCADARGQLADISRLVLKGGSTKQVWRKIVSLQSFVQSNVACQHSHTHPDLRILRNMFKTKNFVDFTKTYAKNGKMKHDPFASICQKQQSWLQTKDILRVDILFNKRCFIICSLTQSPAVHNSTSFVQSSDTCGILLSNCGQWSCSSHVGISLHKSSIPFSASRSLVAIT